MKKFNEIVRETLKEPDHLEAELGSDEGAAKLPPENAQAQADDSLS